MNTLICKKDFNACRTPGMCAPHGGCQVDKSEWQAGYDEGRCMGTKHMYAEVDRLKAENEALREDAERYRFLRNSRDDIEFSSAETMEEVDALIDAAMSKEASHE